MPIYDYLCGACRHRFEVFHGLNEAGPHQCPQCGGPVTRAFAPPTIVFKGSGWAKVDRRSSGPSGSRKSSSGGASSDDGATTKAAGETAGTTSAASPGGAPASGAADA